MLQTERGSVFIGFTGEIRCERCSNISQMHLRQKYLKSKFFFVDQGTDFFEVVRLCSICETEYKVGETKSLFNRKESGNLELQQLLNDGGEKTKAWLRSIPEPQMDKILERYYSLKAFDFMRFILK